MMAQIEITPGRYDHRGGPSDRSQILNLVAVSSENRRTESDGGSDQPSPAVTYPLKASGNRLFAWSGTAGSQPIAWVDPLPG